MTPSSVPWHEDGVILSSQANGTLHLQDLVCLEQPGDWAEMLRS
jgi:hypothetical protein